MLTVGDLKKILETKDDNLVVFVDGHEFGLEDLKLGSIVESKVVLNYQKPFYCGPHAYYDDLMEEEIPQFKIVNGLLFKR